MTGPRERTSTSVERAFELLERVAAAGPRGISLVELAATVPTATSTTHRYVSTLLNLGMLRRDAAQRLHLGLKLVALASSALAHDELAPAARPVLEELAALTRETVHLAYPLGDEMVYVDKVESPQSVRLVSRVGARVPMHCTAIGKCVLAFAGDDAREAVLARPFEQRTPNTLGGEALVAELEQVRRLGYAIDDEENELGVRCIAVPILSSSGDPLAAASVSAPATRLSRRQCVELAPKMIEIANEIARLAGHGTVVAAAATGSAESAEGVMVG